MPAASIFEMFKIGVGPSSSHTLGPWRAANHFAEEVVRNHQITNGTRVRAHLFGSLALTGKGHGTDIAIIMGLSGYDPVSVPLTNIKTIPEDAAVHHRLKLNTSITVYFDPDEDIIFHWNKVLPAHANGMEFELIEDGECLQKKVYYSTGGGFIQIEGNDAASVLPLEKYPLDQGTDILRMCGEEKKCISELVLENELLNHDEDFLAKNIQAIWAVMKESMYYGCLHEGYLPGGLHVHRRAPVVYRKVCGFIPQNVDEWLEGLLLKTFSFTEVNKLVSALAMAVNEENASFSRVVTAPTNGSAGVIPAVLMYWVAIIQKKQNMEEIKRFLSVATIIGSLFKNKATISAAMGGCQAEIGVSSAMAAGALTELMGGSPGQVLMAAEIAMEHHLGLTCDPIGGLVQIPCIERNSMGAIKAITAANLALDSNPAHAKVSLDQIVETMWDTAKDMHNKYKETSLGGVAAKIKVSIPEC